MILRKRKKIYIEAQSAYEMAERIEEIGEILRNNGEDIKENGLTRLQDYLRKNAFSFYISGAQLRLGGGWIIE